MASSTILNGSLFEEMFKNANMYDQNESFPHDNFKGIADEELHLVTLPVELGGKGYTPEQTSKLITEISSYCSSTGLCIAMHYYTLAGLESHIDNPYVRNMFQEIATKGKFITSFNQPNVMLTAAISSKEKQAYTSIQINKVAGGYIVNGIKPYVSGIECASYIPIFGDQIGFEEDGFDLGITALILEKRDKGVIIEEESWNLSGMRASKSNNVILENVFVPEERVIGRPFYGIEDTSELVYWSRLAISSVYHGISIASFNHTKDLVKQRTDRISKKALSFLPGVQFKVADMKIKLDTSFSQLLNYSNQLEEALKLNRFPNDLNITSMVTKAYISNAANDIVWDAMQIEGMGSLNKGNLLERLYRDVRAATFHQPTEDLLKELLAKKTLGVITRKNRWA